VHLTLSSLLRWPCGHPDLAPYRGFEQPESKAGPVTATFLGTTSVLFQDDETAILSDGFFTRPGLIRVLFGSIFSCIAPDRNRVKRMLETLEVEKIAAVFCGHSHYDHALDAPLIAQITGAKLVGSESTLNVGRGFGLTGAQMLAIRDGETVPFDRFRLTFIQSCHSRGDRFPGCIDKPLKPPARVGSWKTGTTWSVLIEHEGRRVLLHGSANFKPGALRAALRDRPADAVYLGIGTLGKQDDAFVDDYWNEVVRASCARRVIPVHWDDFFRGLDEDLRPMRHAMDAFPDAMARILSHAATDGIEVLLPILGRPTDPFAGLPRQSAPSDGARGVSRNIR
jgi:L-ascorbate metabolism protein UlaG (beta-lactamase superfamily)